MTNPTILAGEYCFASLAEDRRVGCGHGGAMAVPQTPLIFHTCKLMLKAGIHVV
jgi:hypothetical protein